MIYKFQAPTFPIRDERGELVAFGGRILGDGHPKYITRLQPHTALPQRSSSLWDEHRGYRDRQIQSPSAACEGYLDVIACHRAGGSEGAVASLGTALSEDHAKHARSLVRRSGHSYDADGPGQKAASGRSRSSNPPSSRFVSRSSPPLTTRIPSFASKDRRWWKWR